jgi:hypothetical protein
LIDEAKQFVAKVLRFIECNFTDYWIFTRFYIYVFTWYLVWRRGEKGVISHHFYPPHTSPVCHIPSRLTTVVTSPLILNKLVPHILILFVTLYMLVKWCHTLYACEVSPHLGHFHFHMTCIRTNIIAMVTLTIAFILIPSPICI